MCMFFYYILASLPLLTYFEGVCLCGGFSPLKFEEMGVQAHISGRCILAKGGSCFSEGHINSSEEFLCAPLSQLFSFCKVSELCSCEV